MSELEREARVVLDGLEHDGPSAERRARVKSRLLLALGSGAAALGGSAASASPALATAIAGTGATATAAKGLAVGSLLIWFGAGVASGLGVSGVVVAARFATTQFATAPSASPAARARPSPLDGIVPQPELPVRPGPSAAFSEPPRDVVQRSVANAGVSTAARGAGAVPAAAPSMASAPSVASELPAAMSSSLSEEAALLQRAERALAANAPTAALSVLAEHARLFPAGALREEREAARVLAFCALGRVAEARSLARAFVSASPGSVLVPRLERSCVSADVKSR